MNLTDLGWNEYFEQQYELMSEGDQFPGRISKEQTLSYTVFSERGELDVEVTGRFRHAAQTPGDYPAAGDWVILKPGIEAGKALVVARLPRQSFFSRKAVKGGGPKYGQGRTEEQVLAANVDTVFLVTGLDGDCNARRLERYLMIAWNSGAMPVILLNKADVCENCEAKLEEIEAIAIGVPVHLTSATRGDGVEDLRQYIDVGKTVAFLGSSGVGKSTLINALLGSEQMRVGAVRDDDKRGRHTTTHRELIMLPGGGLLLDTPGMRTIKAWGDEDGLRRTFEDIEDLRRLCRFRDCRHSGEPGCAIEAAISDGKLDSARYKNYIKLKKERLIMSVRKDQRARMDVLGKRMKKYHTTRGNSED